ncbi:MAG: aminotransferase class V-fold PLP-dependent enzyme [Ilumatobacteraceae bacterium]
MGMQERGRGVDEVIAELHALREHDVRWQEGRTFGLVFDGGPSVHDVAERAAMMFLHENALNLAAFPSLRQIQNDVVEWTADLLHGLPHAAGFLTSGGTESIQCAVLAARERGRAERGIAHGEIVVAASAHAAFHKSAHLFDMPIHTAAVRADWTADVDAMAEHVNERTVLVVGSAPQFPQGVVDPIPEIAALASTVGANCHVDACMGGFVLPFVERLGHDVPPWDFRVEGVHSISADVHKLGYAPKGASVILHRSRELRRYQTWMFDGWLGGAYGSPNLQGTRSGLPMAAAWAVMQHLGIEGYLERTRDVLATAARIRATVGSIDGLRILGDSRFHLLAMASDGASPDPLDVFALGAALGERGWYLDRQGPPDSLHATVSRANVAVIEDFLADLVACADGVRGAGRGDAGAGYATVD